MSKHEFGIMINPPEAGKRYDEYEPEKYNCISVDDRMILPIVTKLSIMKTYWISLNNAEYGLNYYGVTLIPPESSSTFAELISGIRSFSRLTELLLAASQNDKFVIHYGI